MKEAIHKNTYTIILQYIKFKTRQINPVIAKECLPLAEKTGSGHGVGYYNADNILYPYLGA